MIRFIITLGLLSLVAGEARAGLVTYTETVTASGSLGGTAFTNAVITFTGTGDTANIAFHPGVDQLLLDSFSVNVAGVGSGVFTGHPYRITSGHAQGVVGIQQFPGSVLGTLTSPSLMSYDLSTSIGPLSGTFVGDQGISFATSAGDFSFEVGTSFTNASIQAVAPGSAVPEPSSLIMSLTAAGVGLLAALGGFTSKLGRTPRESCDRLVFAPLLLSLRGVP